MGVPGFYSWLIKRYPLVKHMIDKQQVPVIDYLYLDMNGIIYKCVKNDEIMFKSQILPKQMEEIWLDVFNYINMLVNILKPNKMIVMGLDGVAPRAKMNNQRSRRFKSSRDHKNFTEKLYGFTGQESMENFKNNSISPGTAFMDELGKNLEFFIKKKIEEDDYWRSLSVVFTSSSSPGEGEHKIMEFIRANKDNFLPEDSHCLYGADADLIMLSMTLPLKNLCIIREQYVHGSEDVKISQSKKEKVINFQMIFVSILKEYFEIEYSDIKDDMLMPFELDRIIKDFVFLFFFIGNDFLPRCMAYNIRQTSIEDLIEAFKQFLKVSHDYVVGPEKLNIKALTVLANAVAQRESKFIDEKSEDFDKLVQGKTEFEGQFKQMMKFKAVEEKNFINQLKAFYLNNQVQARNLYYGRYFKLDPVEQPEKFYEILINYVCGLQFVYEYYFINLPSWQWYYPHYCAPLVSDIFFYLNYLSEINHDLPKIDPGTPSEPFKQLLCILPKESSELLPLPFRKLLTEPTSILREPIDYYPDEFDEQPYGSIRSHQYIALIPFLDLTVVNKAYDEAILDVGLDDFVRNRTQLSTLFEYDTSAEDIIIESKFSSIPTKKCTIRETKVNLRDKFKWGINNPEIKNPEKNLFKMPTLKIKSYMSTMHMTRGKKYFVLELVSPQNLKYKLDQQIFYGYPLEKSGKIQAILTPQNFIYKDDFHPYNYYLDNISKDLLQVKFMKDQPKTAFEVIKSSVAKTEKYQFEWGNIDTLVFTAQTQQYVRCLQGSFRPVYYGSQSTKYEIVPSPLISTSKVYQNTMDKVEFKKLDEEFGLGEDVIVFPKHGSARKNIDYFAQKGKVVGYTDKKVKVKLGEKITQVEEKVIEKIVHTREIYFTLQLCSFILEINPDVLLTLLESINIELCTPDMPPSIDIGLNFINRHETKIVPNLVRINFDNPQVTKRDNVQKMFRFMDISLKGFELIIEYKKRFPKIIKFIEARYEKLKDKRDEKGRINWREPIRLGDIYEEEEQEKALKELMQVYIWLIEQEETHMPLSSIYSKQISKKNIDKLQEMFSKNVKESKKPKFVESAVVEVDPNYLFSRRLANLGKMHLQKMPKPTAIRDQVICLQPEFFGELGVVIGFDDVKFEVIFNKPSFGKSDLNGLCKDLWAGRFYERDLYNFETWPEMMRERVKTNNRAENIGWDGSSIREIEPKFKEKALREFEDIKLLSEKYQFNKQFLEFVENAKKNQKVQKLEQGFHVVDNKKKTYALKYDAEIPTIAKEYVQKIAKDKKYMEKQINTLSGDIQVQQYEKQIIENKAETPVEPIKAPETEPEVEEEDVDDMFK